jgi:hypothetical protein
MPPKKKICRRDSPEIQHPPVTKPLEETVEGKEQTRIHQDKTETSTFHNTHKAVEGVTKSTSESESETERPLDVRGQLEVKKKEADAKEEDDDPEQQESIKSEDDDEEGEDDANEEREYNEDDEDDEDGDDEDDSQTDNSDDIVEYEIDGVPVTRREIREIEESLEFQDDMMAGWAGFQTPRPTPRRTQPTILPASHFKCTICGTQAVRRVAGENAMPHNRGRAFYKCPNSAHGRYFKWEDGSAPFSEESQARFNAWMEPLDFDYDY